MAVDQVQVTLEASPNAGLTIGKYVSQIVQAQSFTPTKPSLTGISFYKIGQTGSPGNFVISLRANNSGNPAAAVLASCTLTIAQFTALPVGLNLAPMAYTVTPGTLYWIVVKDANTSETDNNYYSIGYRNSNVYAGGSFNQSTNNEASWTPNANIDMTFMTHYPSMQQTVNVG
jgi:hypothetical protein